MLLLLLPMTMTLVPAQELPEVSPDSTLIDAERCYNSGEYHMAIAKLEGALNNAPRRVLSGFHKYLALCYAGTGNKLKAQEHFKQALRYDAKLKLPPDAPEETVTLFNETKRELSSEAAMCGCMLPGMGQMLKGETRKAQGIMLACGLMGMSAGVSWVITMNKRSEYLDLGPDDIGRIDAAYHDYNRWYRTSMVFTVLFACVYFYGYFDARAVKLDDLSSANKSSTFICEVDDNATRLCFRIRF